MPQTDTPTLESLLAELGVPMDAEALAAPVAEQAPTGVDLREDEASVDQYYRLRDLRTTGRNREREALGEGETDYIRTRDWQPLLEELPSALCTQTKDAELAAWLIEALTRIHGFRGAAAGFHIAARLIDGFGEALYPQPDEDGVASQLAALAGLNGLGTEGALIAPLKSIPLTEGQPPGPFAAWQCEQAFEVARIADAGKREARSQRGYVTREELDQAVAETSSAFFLELHASIRAAVAGFNRYREALDAYTPDNPQPTSRLEAALDECLRTVNHLAGDRLATAAEAVNTEFDDAAEPDTADAEDSGPAPVAQARGIDSRETALQQLREIAQFFRRTEPHSPMSYAIDQVVHWSDLSLPELIQELIPDEGARSRYRTLTGMQTPDE